MDNKLMFAFVVFGFILSTCVIDCSAYCDEYGIQSCQSSSGLKDYLTSQGIDITSQHAYESNWLFTLDRTQLTKYCSLFVKYKSCMDADVVGSCSADIKPLIIGINNAIHFLCKETFEEYLDDHHECMKRESVRDEITDCTKGAIEDMKYDTNKDQLCRDAKEGESCQIDAVKRECGEDTGKWYKTFVTKVDKPTLDHFGCSGLPFWAIFLIVFFGVILLSMVFGCIRIWRNSRRQAPAPTGRIVGRTTLTVVTAERPLDVPPPYTDAEAAIVVSDKKKLVPV